MTLGELRAITSMLAIFTFTMMGMVIGGAFPFHIGVFTGCALAYILHTTKIKGQE